MAEPIQCVAWECPTCHGQYVDRAFAARCCDRHCEACGVSIHSRSCYVFCDPCRAKREAEREAERFAEATKVPEAEYADEWVYSETHQGGGREGYWPDVESLRDWCEGEGVASPAYVWACTPLDLSMHADSAIESALDEHHDDAGSEISDAEVRRLQDFLDEWCDAQGIRSYHTDYKRAVVLSAATPPREDRDG